MKETVLLSIHPQWAEAILDGTKRWEYRRVPPRTDRGSRVILYATEVKSIVGEFTIGEILREPLDRLLRDTLHETPHKREDLYGYFSDLNIGSALRVENPVRYDKPIDISKIRQVEPTFNPPQSFVYLRENDTMGKKILSLLPRAKGDNQRNLSGY